MRAPSPGMGKGSLEVRDGIEATVPLHHEDKIGMPHETFFLTHKFWLYQDNFLDIGIQPVYKTIEVALMFF